MDGRTFLRGSLCLAQQACLPLWRLQGNPRRLPAWPHHLGTCPVPGISAGDSAGIGFGWCGRWDSSAGGCRSRPHGTAGSGGRNPGEGRQRPQLPISANPSSVPRASSPGSDSSIPRPHDRSVFSPPFLSRITTCHTVMSPDYGEALPSQALLQQPPSCLRRPTQCQNKCHRKRTKPTSPLLSTLEEKLRANVPACACSPCTPHR